MLYLGEGIPEPGITLLNLRLLLRESPNLSDSVRFALISPVEVAVSVSWYVVLNYDKLSNSTIFFLIVLEVRSVKTASLC